jgi:hypothetical protein
VIETYTFGKIVIRGKVYTTDVIITQGKVHSWWRNQGHVLNPEDLILVVEDNPDTLVVGTGAHGALQIPEKSRKFLQERGISLIAEKTGTAIDIFNSLPEKKVAALHLTC